MPWTSLAGRLKDLPHVLAGPMLRKVTPESVTVWFALRKGARVRLKVRNPASPTVLLEGDRLTVALGTNLHLVAVTARTVSGQQPLTEGVIYVYEPTFEFDRVPPMNLAEATRNASLAYPPYQLPSFCLPPKDVNFLRILQGSCRKPHTPNAKDSLPGVNALLEQAATNAFARPQQLFMTGDQIYADEVTGSLLLVVTDAAKVLLDWEENLPVPAHYANRQIVKAIQFAPYLRRPVMEDISFSSADLSTHLMSLGEYLCMYLVVWSDVLMNPTVSVPRQEDLRAEIDRQLPAFGLLRRETPPPWHPDSQSSLRAARKALDALQAELESLGDTVEGLKDVRRALANIPSYTIFDDHEITDDWNMTLEICLGMYREPLGRRIIQNGLVAYALCQHWGNAPEQFELQGTQLTPGLSLLQQVDQLSVAAYDARSPQIAGLVGVHTSAQVLAQRAVYHDANSLTYDYTVEGPGHQVIVTDTRTWRSFPDSDRKHVELLNESQIARQIRQTTNLRTVDPRTNQSFDRILFVVLSTNAPPLELIRTSTRNDTTANVLAHFPDVYEAWEVEGRQFHRLLRVLVDKVPLNPNNIRSGVVILMSGDVHHSFASRLEYHAINSTDDVTPQPAAAGVVFAQLVSSGFKNETGETHGMHRHGYGWAPWYGRPFNRPHATEHFAGWSLATARTVGHWEARIPPISDTSERDFRIRSGVVDIRTKTTTLAGGGVELGGGVQVDEFVAHSAPHYRFRLDYLLPVESGLNLNLPLLPSMPPGTSTPAELKEIANRFAKACLAMRIPIEVAVPKIVGYANFSDVTFAGWGTASRKVRHTLRWHSEEIPVATTYQVSLNLFDPAHPAYPLRIEP